MTDERLSLAIDYIKVLGEIPGKHYEEINQMNRSILKEFGVDSGKLQIIVEGKLNK